MVYYAYKIWKLEMKYIYINFFVLRKDVVLVEVFYFFLEGEVVYFIDVILLFSFYIFKKLNLLI